MPPQKALTMGKILVVGANGCLGQKVLRLLGPDTAIAGTRRKDWDSGLFEHISIPNAEALFEIDWKGIRAVINVAGQVKGSIKTLNDANVNFPVKLASAARSGAVPQFIQASSLATYGSASYIDRETLEAPITDYGNTKTHGDRQLHVLATRQFRVASLRIPFLFDADNPSLFRPLFQLIKIAPYFPIASEPTLRSMMSYSDAARTLTAMVDDCSSGIYHAAAPTLFDFTLLEKLLWEEAGYALRTIRMPMGAESLIKLTAPSVYRRLFQSSVLCSRLNIALNTAENTDLDAPLRELIRKHFGVKKQEKNLY